MVVTLTSRDKILTVLLHDLIVQFITNTSWWLDTWSLSLVNRQKLIKKVFIRSHGGLQDLQFGGPMMMRDYAG